MGALEALGAASPRPAVEVLLVHRAQWLGLEATAQPQALVREEECT